jgi:hypothetical protein
MKALASVFALIFLLIMSCSKPEEKPATLFELMSSEETGVQFVNTVENTEDFNLFSYRNFYNGGGVSLGDINNDGLPDIYFTSNMGDNKLYLNKGNFKFEDITATAGVAGTKAWSTGVVMADVNADGFLDIYVCNAGYIKGDDRENELFINNGDLTFTEKAEEYNLNSKGYATHAAFFDYDMDGDLDAYILNNSFIPVNTLNYENKRDLYAEDWPVKDFLKNGGGAKLLRNDNGQFTDVTRQSGIYGSLIGFGLGVTVGDVNGDHLPDMYISNDFFERDYLYLNRGDGTFSEELENWMQHISLQSMGADMADINNDGYPEIFVTEMLPDDELRLKTNATFDDYKIYDLKLKRGFYHQYLQNTLQLNNQNNTFSEIAWYSGVAASDWSWGALMFDADNDGYKDIYVCNGIYKDETNLDFINFFANDVIQKMALTGQKKEMDDIISKIPSVPQRNKFYHNNKDLTFSDNGVGLGFDTPSFSNGAAYGDLDNDGDLDLVVNNVNQEAFIYRSNAGNTGNHYVKMKLKGTGRNTYAVGSKVTAFCGKERIVQELIPTRGFQSSIDYSLVLGLGNARTIDSVEIIWPDRMRSILKSVPSDTTLVFDYTSSDKKAISPVPLNKVEEQYLVTQEIPGTLDKHSEDKHIDFYQEGLVIRMLSREGPKAAIGDVNGDGRDDIFMCAASGKESSLYLQKSGGFVKTNNKFKADLKIEDTAASFVDVDGDKDLDLVVGSGGNHFAYSTPQMQNRLYINEGGGNFKERKSLPETGFNCGVILSFDFDGDGDLDLFSGSRSIPSIYGMPPKSYLFENDGKGVFTDVTVTYAPSFEKLGLITDAKFKDLTGDGKNELIIVGEWMAPRIFEIKNKRFELLASTALDGYSGWYYAVEAEDLDGDGDLDLVLGNRGENFYFTASAEEPAKLWVNDFDNNGMYEKVLSRTVAGRDVPLPMKNELTSQVPSLRKKILKFDQYAKLSMQELFTPEVMQKAQVFPATWFKSSVALNDGKGKFTVKALPREVQLSCVCAICVRDVDSDGRKDIIMGGNFDGFTPQYSKLDAGYGNILINQGNGQFSYLPNRQSGFSVRGDIKQFSVVKVDGDELMLTMLNNEKPRFFKIGKPSTLKRLASK